MYVLYKNIILYHLYSIVCKDRNEALKIIDEKCIELYKLKLKILNMINRKIEFEECPYILNKDANELLGMERVYIQLILEEIWKSPEIMYFIITKYDVKDINYNLSSFIINNFYNNILSSSNIEDNFLYLLSLLLKDEISKLINPEDLFYFLNETICGILLEQIFKQNDIQIYFKSILMKIIEQLELINSNRKIKFAPSEKEVEFSKYENVFKKNILSKSKNISKEDILNELINNIIFENFSCNRMDLLEKLIINKIDHELFIVKYIPDLTKNELEEKIKIAKDKNDNDIIEYYQIIIKEIDERNYPELFSNKTFLKNIQSSKLSMEVLQFYRTDFNIIIAYIEQILKNLKENVHLLPYSVKCICKIISILIQKHFPQINIIQKNSYVSCFLFQKIILKILKNPAVNTLIGEFIISENTLYNLNTICKILEHLSTGSLFKNGSLETNYTPFNWFILDKMPELISFYEHIYKVPLPDIIDKFVNDKLDKNYKYSYFKENYKEILTHMSICYNIDNIISILNCVDKNKEEISKLVSANDPKCMLIQAFNRLYKEKNLEKIMNFSTQKPDINITAYNNIAITKTSPTINFFLYNKIIINEKFQVLFDLDSTIYKNFHLKEIEDPKTPEEKDKSIIIKIKNYISNALFNYKLLEKNDFEEGSINDTISIFKELKRFMESSNFVSDNSVPSMWYINSLLNQLNKIPEEYKKNDFDKLFLELKSDLENNINSIDFERLILFKNKLKFLSLSNKQYVKSNLLVKRIDINQIIKIHIEEESIPVEIDFQYDNLIHKLKLENSKIKLPQDCEYIRDPKRGLITRTISAFTKKFPNLARHQYLQNAEDIFEMLKELQLPKKLKSYFNRIASHFDRKFKKTHDSKYDYNEFKDELADYVMKKLYEKIYPQDPCMKDTLTFKKCVMLSWTEPKHFISQKKNYVYDSFLPDVIALFKQIHQEKTPVKKMECVKNIFKLINSVIKFNDRKSDCGADDSTSILIYSMVQASPFFIYSDLKFLETFYEKEKQGIEESYLVQLFLALDFIDNIEANTLGMDVNDFNQKCTEAMNNPNNNANNEK